MAEESIRKVEVNGIEVEVDTAYMQSWRGVKLAARMQAGDRTEAEKLTDIIAYYEAIVPNLPDIEEAMPDAPAAEMVELLAEAVGKAVPKN